MTDITKEYYLKCAGEIGAIVSKYVNVDLIDKSDLDRATFIMYVLSLSLTLGSFSISNLLGIADKDFKLGTIDKLAEIAKNDITENHAFIGECMYESNNKKS